MTDGSRERPAWLAAVPRLSEFAIEHLLLLPLGAAIALKMLVADGTPQTEVYIAAGSRDQATIAFTAAQRMVEGSTWLTKRCQIRPGIKRIYGIQDSVLHVISAEGPLQHGLRPTCVIFDEVWNQRKRDLYDALQGGRYAPPSGYVDPYKRFTGGGSATEPKR